MFKLFIFLYLVIIIRLSNFYGIVICVIIKSRVPGGRFEKNDYMTPSIVDLEAELLCCTNISVGTSAPDYFAKCQQFDSALWRKLRVPFPYGNCIEELRTS